jgi:hypothetical protein|uniref:Uncharacterized protein n=1 Tax=Tectiviridae sp. TaxID=2831614 RepID=A0A8S5VTW2_9VIRU|nr:MAG TPA: hypothetical protein [Tectiviridae sp.]
MDFDEILDWVNDNKIIIIAGAVGVAFFMTMLNKNSDSKTIVQPVTTGSSYPTVSENAETIMSNMSKNIIGSKQEILEAIDAENKMTSDKISGVKSDVLEQSKANTSDIMDLIKNNQKETLKQIEQSTVENNNKIKEAMEEAKTEKRRATNNAAESALINSSKKTQNHVKNALKSSNVKSLLGKK